MVVKSERNFQIEILALLVNVFLILYFELTVIGTTLILVVCFLVLVMEVMNTSIEKLADFVEPKYHPQIGIVKDISAGAVLLAAILALIVGFIIYRPYILDLSYTKQLM